MHVRAGIFMPAVNAVRQFLGMVTRKQPWGRAHMLAVIAWCLALAPLELLIEVGQVEEATDARDRNDRLVGFDQQLARTADTDLDQEVLE